MNSNEKIIFNETPCKVSTKGILCEDNDLELNKIKKIECNKIKCKNLLDLFIRTDNENFKKKYIKSLKQFGPSNSTEWLSNLDIDNVLIDWQKAYPNFYMHNFGMADNLIFFDNVINMLDELFNKNNNFMIGTIVNTDNSMGSGIHWYAILLSFDYNTKIFNIEYFNSSGEFISNKSNELKHWYNKSIELKNYIIEKYSNYIKNIKLVDVANGKIYQKDDHSCGIYSLAYIWYRINNIPLNDFTMYKINFNDNLMLKFRKIFFIDKNILNIGG
tara:strand:+ start:3714 stop:4532 length:819 start_codon:yes stop_codon:yes gene_type:complete